MFPELATNRFLLRQILPDDQPFIYDALSHPQVIPFYGVQYKTMEETTAQMQYYSQLWRDSTGAWWKIVDRWSFEKVGAIGFNNYSVQHQKCEIGYWLLPAYWGRGIIAEALQAMINYLFTERKVHRIEALVEPANAKSSRVATKAGFTLEGTLRDYERKNESYISLQVFSLLATEWKKKT